MKRYRIKLIQIEKNGNSSWRLGTKAQDENILFEDISKACKNILTRFEKNKNNKAKLIHINIKKTFPVTIKITDTKYWDVFENTFPSFWKTVSYSTVDNLTEILKKGFAQDFNFSKEDNGNEIEIPKEFSETNDFEKEGLALINNKDYSFKDGFRVIKYLNQEIKSIFSDYEAFSICLGLDDRHSRHIARQFFKGKSNDEHIIEGHMIAMKALDKYGYEHIKYVISLPPLPVKALDAQAIFSELEKKRNLQENPILRIGVKNHKNQTEKIYISYYSKKVEGKRRKNNNILVVKNKTTGTDLFKISRDGKVIPNKRATGIIPVLRLFMRFSKDTKGIILNYGQETGECSVCGRELTDTESIKLGVGPVCKQYL